MNSTSDRRTCQLSPHPRAARRCSPVFRLTLDRQRSTCTIQMLTNQSARVCILVVPLGQRCTLLHAWKPDEAAYSARRAQQAEDDTNVASSLDTRRGSPAEFVARLWASTGAKVCWSDAQGIIRDRSMRSRLSTLHRDACKVVHACRLARMHATATHASIHVVVYDILSVCTGLLACVCRPKFHET